MSAEKNSSTRKTKKIVVWLVVAATLLALIAPVVAIFLGSSGNV